MSIFAFKSRSFFSMPLGFGSLFFTQMFSTISFAVLYATLVLYMKHHLHMSSEQADLITGVYFACNFTLHLLSGYMGGRIFSYRGLVIVGIVFQLIGCVILSVDTLATFYWGLACMLIGTGTMVTCLNMLLSQLFGTSEIQQRQTGFLWNYSGMNIGFMLGFTLAGYFQIHLHYSFLFLITAANNIVALVILLARWKYMADKNTIFSNASPQSRYHRILTGVLIVLALAPTLRWLLYHTTFADDLVLALGALVCIFLLVTIFKYTGAQRHKFFVFFILLMGAQVFWIVYQLAPMALTLFAKNNVNLRVLGFQLAPGWIQNINSITIIVGAPLLGILFVWLHRKIRSPLLPLQYSFGLAISGIGLLILPIGIAFSHQGYTAFVWLFATFVLQAVAELLISPIGYSMVGQLVPSRWQSFCMGTILLNSGVAAVLSSYFSNYALGTSGSSNPLITNVSYSHSFSLLGWTTLGIGVVLFLFSPVLNRLLRG